MKTEKYMTRTEKNFKKLSNLMSENPSTSQKTTATRISVSQKTIRRMLSDLNLCAHEI